MATTCYDSSPSNYRISSNPAYLTMRASTASHGDSTLQRQNRSLSSSDSSSSLSTIASGASDTTLLRVCGPLSPPESDHHTPSSLIDQIHSFISDAKLLPHPRNATKKMANFTAHRQFLGISVSTYHEVIRKLADLENTSIDWFHKPRINYFGHRSLLTITIPGQPHEFVAVNSQIFLRQALFDQGFYWPSWGDDIERVQYTGAADCNVGDKENQSWLQPDGSLVISGSDMPFMVIEVADSETYEHARAKASTLLKRSKGSIRFVVIINLIRATAREAGRESVAQVSQRDKPEPEITTLGDESSGRLILNKRAARDSDPSFGPESTKKPRGEYEHTLPVASASGTGASPKETPPSSPHLPPLLPTSYSCATVTVLTSTLTPHPKLPGKRQRSITTLVDTAKCWPAFPGPESTFSFSWDDINVVEYPAEMKGRTFTISWGWLHTLLTKRFTAHEDVPKGMVDGDDVVEGSSEETGVVDDGWEEERISSGRVGSDDTWLP